MSKPELTYTDIEKIAPKVVAHLQKESPWSAMPELQLTCEVKRLMRSYVAKGLPILGKKGEGSTSIPPLASWIASILQEMEDDA